jgi:hypothetical protein
MGGNKAIIPPKPPLGILKGCQNGPDSIRKDQNLPIQAMGREVRIDFQGICDILKFGRVGSEGRPWGSRNMIY